MKNILALILLLLTTVPFITQNANTSTFDKLYEIVKDSVKNPKYGNYESCLNIRKKGKKDNLLEFGFDKFYISDKSIICFMQLGGDYHDAVYTWNKRKITPYKTGLRFRKDFPLEIFHDFDTINIKYSFEPDSLHYTILKEQKMGLEYFNYGHNYKE